MPPKAKVTKETRTRIVTLAYDLGPVRGKKSPKVRRFVSETYTRELQPLDCVFDALVEIKELEATAGRAFVGQYDTERHRNPKTA